MNLTQFGRSITEVSLDDATGIVKARRQTRREYAAWRATVTKAGKPRKARAGSTSRKPRKPVQPKDLTKAQATALLAMLQGGKI